MASLTVGVNEAERLDLNGYEIEKRSDAAGGALVRTFATGTASGTFAGATGSYDIKVNYFNESDGVATWILLVNSEVRGSWDGTGGEDGLGQSATEILTGIELATGDEVSLLGRSGDAELARVDRLTVTHSVRPPLEATRLLPNLQAEVSVPESLRNGTNPADFTLGASRDALVTFRSLETSSQDTVGCYLIRQDGTIDHPVILFPDCSKVAEGTTVRLSNIYASDLLQPGTQFGLFLIADGAGDDPGGTGQPNPGLSEGEAVRVAFVASGEDPTGAPASVNDVLPPDLYLADMNQNGGASFTKSRGDIYHSATPTLNFDGNQHVLSGLEVGSRPIIDIHPDWWAPDRGFLLREYAPPAELRDGVVVGFEDLRSEDVRADFGVTSDFDFNDVVLQVNVGNGGLPPLRNGIAVPVDQINGVDPNQLTIGPAQDAKIIFDSETASARSALGAYLVDADGTIHDARLLFPPIEQVDRVDGLKLERPGNPFPLDDFGGPHFLHREDSVGLRDFYSAEQLQPGTRFGLFLVADAGQLNSQSALNAPAFALLNAATGAAATIFDRADQIGLLALDADGSVSDGIKGAIFHTTDPTPSTPGDNPLNSGGQGQVVSGITDETMADGRVVRVVSIGFEDRVNASKGSDGDFNDLVVRAEIPQSAAEQPTVLRTFTGPSGDFGGIDEHIAVGPEHVVITVNGRICIYDKEGVLLDSHHLGQGWFPDEFLDPGDRGKMSPNADGRVFDFGSGLDSRVLYDSFSDRFVFSSLIVETHDENRTVDSRVVLGVSKTNDPADGWYFSYIPSAVDGRWSDFPTLGLDEESLYLSGDMHNLDVPPEQRPEGDDTTGSNSRLWIIAKGEGREGLYDGGYHGGAADARVYDPAHAVGAQSSVWQPALIVGSERPAGDTGTFLSGYDASNSELEVIRIDDPLGQTSFTLQAERIAGQFTGGASVAPQLMTPDALLAAEGVDKGIDDSAINRVHQSVWRDGTLYFVVSAAALSSDPEDGGQTTAYLMDADTSNPGQLIFADPIKIGGEDIAPLTHVLYPSLAVNGAGDVVVGFTGTGPVSYAGAYVAGFLSDGTRLATVPVREGEASYVNAPASGDTRNRWGDYSGAAVDPSDDQSFWVFNMYAATRGDMDSYTVQTSDRIGDGRFETVISHLALDQDTLLA